MASIEHQYSYLSASSLMPAARPRLMLATSSASPDGGDLHPHFFEGALKAPRLTAELLTALHLIVGSRFFTPPNMLARLLALADPVVTCGGGWLRFEGFSACCSTYIRADILPAAYDGDVVGKGSTNVDFNAPMRSALARVRDADGLGLSVGREQLQLMSGGASVIEKKVSLPLRWVRGMLEVQSYMASMHKLFDANPLDALRFFRSLPKVANSKHPVWLMATASGMRITATPTPGAVRVMDLSRLRVLESLLPKAKSLSVYADAAQQANAWVLDFGSMRLTLALSAEVWRGFSGEGQALRALLKLDQTASIAMVRAQLAWQSQLEPQQLAQHCGLPVAQLADILRILGVSGLVGFDVAESAYFHRVLPLDLGMADDMHTRLVAARELLQQGALHLVRRSPLEVLVQSADTQYRVREVDGEMQCTCPWFGKFQGTRGPCKHVLAVEAGQMAESKPEG